MLERCLAFIHTDLARQLLFHADISYPMKDVRMLMDESGKAKIDLTSLQSLPTLLTPGVALNLGIKLIMAAMNAVDENTMQLIRSLEIVPD